MPPIPDRDEYERKIGRLAARALNISYREAYDRLTAGGTKDPELANLGTDYWELIAAEMRRILAPEFERMVVRQGEIFIGQQGSIGVDWGLVNVAAAQWARSYAGSFAKGRSQTTRQLINESVAQFFEDGWTMKQLQDSLQQRIASPVRAAMIAGTEVTRSSVQGELIVVDALNREGVQLTAEYETMNDSRVSEICQGLHHVIADAPGSAGHFTHQDTGIVYGFAPNHVLCRSYQSWHYINRVR